MTQLAADYLYAPASPSAIKAAGYSAVLRYLRNLTATEIAQIHAAGLGLATIFETLATEALGGAAKGAADGALVRSQCLSLGQPAGSLVTFNIADFKPTAAQMPLLQEYLVAFEQALGTYKFGPYVTNFALEKLTTAGVTGQFWWENAMTDTGVTGDTSVNPLTALYQRVTPSLHITGATGSWDEDVVCNTFTIPWWTGAAPAPTPTPPPVPQPSVKTVHVLIKGGEGWCASPVPVTQIGGVVPFDQNPAVIGRYPNVPCFAAVASEPTSGAPHGVLVFGSLVSRVPPDGVYGANVSVLPG